MKRYRAVVIDGKKIIRRSLVFLIAALVGSLATVNIKIAGADKRFAVKFFEAERILGESIPGLYRSFEGEGMSAIAEGLNKVFTFALGFDPKDERTVIFGEIPLVRTVSAGYLAREADLRISALEDKQGATVSSENVQYPIKEVDSSQAKALGKNSGKILIRNETDYSINIEEMLAAPLAFDMKGKSPKVLIVHTHGTESYAPEGAQTYEVNKSDRSLDKSQNVVKVGEAMKQIFEEKGISVIHDTTLHDHPNFNGSYENSKKTVNSYLKKYPEICIVLDVHRDAFIYDDGSKAKFVSEINGKKAALLMFVVGSDAGGLEHPQWKENMKLALKLQNAISQRYPTLMRGVNLRTERFNGHLTKGSMIIEVGSSGNTLSESVEGAKLGAEAIADFLNTLK